MKDLRAETPSMDNLSTSWSGVGISDGRRWWKGNGLPRYVNSIKKISWWEYDYLSNVYLPIVEILTALWVCKVEYLIPVVGIGCETLSRPIINCAVEGGNAI